jgi:hypothetical protein
LYSKFFKFIFNIHNFNLWVEDNVFVYAPVF